MSKAELLTIGDDLLYGHTIDTNAAFIGERLADTGVELIFHTTVGDHPQLLLSAIAQAMKRADVVLATGGLGPTPDDITKKVICKYFKRQLVYHDDIRREIEKRFKERGVAMPPINQNQALLPQGASFLKNSVGTAYGIAIEEEGRLFISMPGVPAEMKPMLTEQVIPLLKQNFPAEPLVHRRIRTVGIMESVIYEKAKDIVEQKSPVRIAFLPSFRGVDLRLTMKAGDETKVRKTIGDLEKRIVERLDKYIFGYDDDELADVVGRKLLDRKMTMAVAESCTGGLLGKIITDISGSSAYFVGGVIAYSNELKMKLLGVRRETIEKHGAVSEQAACAMAEGARKKTRASIGVSITGIAGPTGGTDEKPVGLTFIGLATPEGTNAKRFQYGADREHNRLRASISALDTVRRYLDGIE